MDGQIEARVVPEVCGQCGTSGHASFGEHVGDWPGGESQWRSFRCLECGAAYELDGIGPLPEDLRRAELEFGGTWVITIESLEPGALNRIRAAMGLTITELATAKTNKGPAFSGTRAEARRVELELRSRGVELCVKQRTADAEAIFDIAVLWQRLLDL